MERVERIRPATLLTIATLALAAYYLLPQLAGVGNLLDAAPTAGLWWLALTVLASAMTYLGAAVGLIGSVPARLQLWPTFFTQVASSFANRITPAKVGGMAINVRYLQRQGLRISTAISAVGLNTIAGFSVHIALLLLAGVAAGNTASADIAMPSERALAWVVGGLILVSGVFMALPIGRRLITQNLWPAVRSAAASIGAIARKPAKLSALFGGSFVVTASYSVAMFASLRAVGDDTPIAVAVAVYLAAAAVATAAPTPGGLGATEAALIAGYVAVGVDGRLAVTAVLLFRLVTFWLPILPGWLAVHSCNAREGSEAMEKLPEHVMINRAVWNDDAPNWVEAGERAWASPVPYWGIWGVPDEECPLLPFEMEGLAAIELGCGTGYVSGWMARRGASVTGIDISEGQLATARRLAALHGVDLTLIQGGAEDVRLPDGSFDFAVSEYGAALLCDPFVWLPEAHRLLRPGGLSFLTNHPIAVACSPLDGSVPILDTLQRDYFGMHRQDWRTAADDPGGIEFHLTVSDWVRLFDTTGFGVLALYEPRPSHGGDQITFSVTADWATRWPSEIAFRLKKRG